MYNMYVVIVFCKKNDLNPLNHSFFSTIDIRKLDKIQHFFFRSIQTQFPTGVPFFFPCVDHSSEWPRTTPASSPRVSHHRDA